MATAHKASTISRGLDAPLLPPRSLQVRKCSCSGYKCSESMLNRKYTRNGSDGPWRDTVDGQYADGRPGVERVLYLFRPRFNRVIVILASNTGYHAYSNMFLLIIDHRTPSLSDFENPAERPRADRRQKIKPGARPTATQAHRRIIYKTQ